MTTASTGTNVTIVGEVDADNCTDFSSRLLQIPTDDKPVVVDLSGLSFIDSSGISELLRVSGELASRGQKFTITHPTAAVRRVLDITGLLEHFGVDQAG